MTGPEHYREAERLMHDEGWENPVNSAHAQVHATLALAAATIDVRGVKFDNEAWSEATA